MSNQQTITQVPVDLLANQVNMIEDYQNISMSNQKPKAPVAPTQQVQQQAMQPTQQVQQQATQPTQQANPYQSIIDQQNAQIAALMAQNNALNQQVTQMVQGGAQFNQQQQQQQVQQVGQNWAAQPVQQFPPVYGGDNGMPLSLAADVDISLESLAKEIGKKPE